MSSQPGGQSNLGEHSMEGGESGGGSASLPSADREDMMAGAGPEAA